MRDPTSRSNFFFDKLALYLALALWVTLFILSQNIMNIRAERETNNTEK